MSRLPLVLVAAAVALLLGGCGGDDREEVEQTVRDFVRATDHRDVDTFCGELVSEEYLEQSTGTTGNKAKDACKDQLRAITGLRIALVRIRKTEIDGDRAAVTAVLKTQGRRDVRQLRLSKEGGDWKLAGGRGQ
jgi:Domain of unknown function (DUF4878)